MRQIFLLTIIIIVLLTFAAAPRAVAQASLNSIGILPLSDSSPAAPYKGQPGGLYPTSSGLCSAAHFAPGLALARGAVQPLNAEGKPDFQNGRIVLLSIGMSNTTQEFSAFVACANADPARNPRLVVVDGAQGGKAADSWAAPDAPTWAVADERLAAAGVTPSQVQVAWIKQAEIRPAQYGAFPDHARYLQRHLEVIARNLKLRYPNIKIAYLSSRTRAYTNQAQSLNPEPFAFESAFSVRWAIQDQMEGKGNLNYDPERGAAVAPWLAWGPYLWGDGATPRSDGFVWLSSDTRDDFTHPSQSGRFKVAAQLLAFFKTEPTATPWFLRHSITGKPPYCQLWAEKTTGRAPLAVELNAEADDPDGVIHDLAWSFGDGTTASGAKVVKIFRHPDVYNVHLTATDNAGNTAAATAAINVAE